MFHYLLDFKRWEGALSIFARGKHMFLIFLIKQSLELTRVNADRNIFSINVELTSTFLL